MWRHVTGRLDQSPSDVASYVRTTVTRTPLTPRIRPPPLPVHLQTEYKMVDKAARTLPYVLDGGVHSFSLRSPYLQVTTGQTAVLVAECQNEKTKPSSSLELNSGHQVCIDRCWKRPTPNCVRLTP